MARDPQAEEAAIEAARRKPVAQAVPEARRRTSVPRSTTASGIRLAVRTAPPVPVQDALPLQQAQTWSLVTPEQPVSPAESAEKPASVIVAATVTVFAVVAVGDRAGEVGVSVSVSASDGPTGASTGV